MAKKKEKLTPIPTAEQAGPVGTPKKKHKAAATEPAAPDLSFISPDIRHLATPVDQLQFHPKNPNKHSEKSIEKIAASLRVNGHKKNIVASTRLDPPVVVSGNGQLAAALQLGWTHLACSKELMTEAQENQFLVTDNETGADPEWDEPMLAELYKDMDTGNDPVLDAMLSELATKEGIAPDDPETTTLPELTPTAIHSVIVRYADEDEPALKTFVGQTEPGPLDPTRGGRYILERIKEIVAAGADKEQ